MIKLNSVSKDAEPAPVKLTHHTGVSVPPSRAPSATRQHTAYDHTTDGRRALDAACQAKDLDWAIISSRSDGRVTGLRVLIGKMYTPETADGGHSQAAIEDCLHKLAKEISSKK